MADVLFLTQRIPYPPNKGEKIRSFRLLERLARRHRVHLGCLIDDPDDLQHRDTVRGMVADAHFGVLDRRRARIWSLRGLLTGEGLSVTYFGDAGLRAWVRRVLTEVKPKAGVVSSSNMAPYLLDEPDRPPLLVADVVDVDSAKFAHYAREARPPMRWVFAREADRIAALERRLAAEAAWCTLVSEPEAALFRQVALRARARVLGVPNGVDTAFFSPEHAAVSPYDGAGPVLAFTGHMDYPPNIDAALWLAHEILPLVRRTVPAARLAIVGANPAREVQALASRPEILVTGRVPDVRPYVRHATVCVAPLRIARGIQNKVLEAMAMGRPTVVTTAALTGIAAEPGRDVLLADTPRGIADAVLQALDPAHALALGAQARRFVVEHHGWDHTFAAFDTCLRGLDGPEPVRGAAE